MLGRYKNLGILSATLLIVTACGQQGQNGVSSSNTKVTNGTAIGESKFPSVVMLYLLGAAGEAGICTATFVNDHQVISAGHCVEGQDTKKPTMYYVKHSVDEAGKPSMKIGARAISYVRNPAYKIDGDDNGINGNDVSVIDFPANTAPAVSEIAAKAPASGDDLTIVGYGNNETYLDMYNQLSGDGAGSKRYGTNKVREISEEGMILFVGVLGQVEGLESGSLVSAGAGDSGGPMFVNDKLVGVTSGGGMAKLKDSEQYIGVSRYVDLNSTVSKTFLDAHLAKKVN